MRKAALVITLPVALFAWGCGDSAPAPVAAPDRSAPAPAARPTQPVEESAAPMANMTFPALGSESAEMSEGVLEAAGIVLDVPGGWASQQPSSSMRMAQYDVPGPGGDAEAVVYCFGPGQGGDAQSNIARWAGQFHVPDHPGTPPTPEVAQMETDGLTVHTVQVVGTYTPGMGPMMAQGEPQPGHALYGVIVEGGPQGTVFVKVTGPEETIEAQRENLEAMAAGARP